MRVGDVFVAEVEPGVVQEGCDAVGMKEAVVVGGAAGGFEDGDGVFLSGAQQVVPELLEGGEGGVGQQSGSVEQRGGESVGDVIGEWRVIAGEEVEGELEAGRDGEFAAGGLVFEESGEDG